MRLIHQTQLYRVPEWRRSGLGHCERFAVRPRCLRFTEATMSVCNGREDRIRGDGNQPVARFKTGGRLIAKVIPPANMAMLIH